MFSKGDNFRDFMFANMDVFPKTSLLLKKEFAPMRANSVFQELTLVEVRGKQENDKIVSPKSVPIHFKVSSFYKLYGILVFELASSQSDTYSRTSMARTPL